MSKIPVALELYSVRDVLAEDLPGTLKAVADMGYDGVEFFGGLNYDPAELRDYCAEYNLGIAGWHTPLAAVQDDTLDATIEFNKTLGNTNIIVPSIPAEQRQTLDDWVNWGAFFTGLAEKLAAHGMRTGYHNHHMEFEELDGGIPWYALFDNASDQVIPQLDNGHALRAHADVVEVIKRYPGQAITVHLAPYSHAVAGDDPRRGYDPIIGEDEIPWEAFLTACETVGGTEWYIIEYEGAVKPSLEGCRRCLDGLRALGR